MHNKFDVLKYNQAFMAWLGIYSHNLLEPTNEFFKSFIAYYFVIIFVMAFYGSAVFAEQNRTVLFKETLGALKVCIAAAQALGSFVNIGLKTSKIKALHLALQQLTDEVDNIEVRDIYWKCEAKCRKLTKMIGCYVFFHISGFILIFLKALYRFIVLGDNDCATWFLLMDLSLPIPTTNIPGWFLTLFIYTTMAGCYALAMTSVSSYFVSCCFYINAICDHFKFSMNLVNKYVECNETETNRSKIQKNRLKMIQTLNTVIKIHVKIFDIFYMLSKIMSGSIFAILPLNAIIMALEMYGFEESATNFDARVLAWDISCLLTGLMWPALICHSATVIGERIASIGDVSFDSNWYNYPTEQQKYITLIIARSQEPAFFSGLNVVQCTLGVFGKILRSACSYYLLFRKLR